MTLTLACFQCVQYSLEPLLVQIANSSFQPKPRKIFNDIKWQNLVFSLTKFENLQKTDMSKFMSYGLQSSTSTLDSDKSNNKSN